MDRATITAAKLAGSEVSQGPPLIGPVAGRDRARRTLVSGLRLDEDDQGLG